MNTRTKITVSESYSEGPVRFGEDKFHNVHDITNMVLILYLEGKQLPKNNWPKDQFLEKHGVYEAHVQYVFSRGAYKVSFIWGGLHISTYVTFCHSSRFFEYK